MTGSATSAGASGAGGLKMSRMSTAVTLLLLFFEVVVVSLGAAAQTLSGLTHIATPPKALQKVKRHPFPSPVTQLT
jgi:hypothetical protein